MRYFVQKAFWTTIYIIHDQNKLKKEGFMIKHGPGYNNNEISMGTCMLWSNIEEVCFD
jgi:hypothetical protein